MPADNLMLLKENGGSAMVAEEGSESALPLTIRLREGTNSLHADAERSGIVAEILHGRVEPWAYALLLRNLLPVYQQMESGLERLRALPWINPIALREIYRAQALEADLARIAGPNWQKDLAILPAADQYADRVAAASEAGGALLAAHAYVRYLGDLNGGQVLKRLLSRSLALDEASLSFYEFADIADLDAFKRRFRAALDRVGDLISDIDAIVAEARTAFLLNIALSKEVKTMSEHTLQATSPEGLIGSR